MEAIWKPRRAKAALLVVLQMMLVSTLAWTQDADSEHSVAKYRQSSLCGDYAAVADYGANVARALGTLKFDGKGKLSGSALANQPGPNDTRSISHIELSGTYSVNSDGSGVMDVDVRLANGATANVIEDFVITKVKWIKGSPIAFEIVDAQEEPSAVIDDRVLVTHTYTLRSAPDTCIR